MSDSLTTETATTQAAPDYVNEREEGRKALKELLKPVQGSLMIGRILAGLSGVLAIAPYIALVQLGGLFATAYATGQPVDADRAMLIVQILISTFCLRIFLLFIALGVTHFADARFVSYVRPALSNGWATRHWGGLPAPTPGGSARRCMTTWPRFTPWWRTSRWK